MSLLELAAAGEGVDFDRLVDFARAAIESTPLGRAALGVLDGGEHSARRAVELCRLVLAQARAERVALTQGAQ